MKTTSNKRPKPDYLKVKIVYKYCRSRDTSAIVYLNYAFEITYEGDGEDPCEAQFEAFMEKWKTKGVFKYQNKFIPFHHIVDIEILAQ